MSGGFDLQTYQPKRRWQIHEELSQQYKVENVDPDKDYDGDEAKDPKDPKDDKAAPKPKKEPLSCLIVPQPSSLTQEQMDRLKTWILAGRPTLLLEDPVPLSAPGTAADDPKGGTRSMFGGGGGPQKGDFQGFLAALDLRMPRGEVVWDSSSRNWFDGRIPYKHFVFAGPAGMSQDSPITKGLQTVVFLTGGEFEEQKKEGFTVTPLVCSPDPTKTGSRQAENGTLPKLESAAGRGDGVLVWDPFGSVQMNPQPFYAHRVNQAIPMAVRVTSKPADGQKSGVELICVADLDVIGDQMFQLRKQNRDPNLRFDNVPFVLNCIDSLTGDESLIEVRKRRPMLRHLTTVEKAQVEFERAWADESQAAEEEARNALQKAQERLDAAVNKIREDKDLDEQAKEERIIEREKAETRGLDLEKAQIDTRKHERVEKAAHKRDEARRRIYNGYRGWTLGLSLVAPLIMGVVTFLRRRAREAAIVPQNRMVHGGVK
jgi:ABC-2 type transport system permease protein